MDDLRAESKPTTLETRVATLETWANRVNERLAGTGELFGSLPPLDIHAIEPD